MRVTRLAYLATHPIQYHAPLLRRIAAEPDIALTAFFESDVSTRGYFDREFGRTIEWDVKLLDGYRHQMLPALGGIGNATPNFWRPVSVGLLRRLLLGRFDALWVHGYARAHHMAMLAAARTMGLRTLLRDDVWLQSRPRDAAWTANKARLWPLIDVSVSAYLAVGKQNAAYYRLMGARDEKIFTLPYAVDNAWFRRRIAATTERSTELRRSLSIGADQLVFLQPAKLIPLKRHDLAIDAFAKLQQEGLADRAVLLVAGDGSERPALERRIADAGLGNVRMLGFQSQSEMAALYGLADVCLLPSRWETWGLAVNEAMNGACAIIASDRVGSAPDLVQQGVNGLVVPHDDGPALSAAIHRLATAPDETRRMGRASLAMIDNWSFEQNVAGLRQALKLASAS
ncbi:MAG: glycosyltransferase family 4 protein [Rhodospirillales bacterium]